MTDLDLHEVLSRASEGLDSPELVPRAVDLANARLARRRGALAMAVAAAVVAGVVLVPRVAGPSPEPVKDPAISPTPTPSVVDSDPATQPLWDPRTVGDAPLRPTRVPARLSLQDAQGSSLDEQPMSGIVAALPEQSSMRLLDVDGTWRTVAVEPVRGASFGVDDVARPAISSDGTRVALATDAGIRVIDVTGDERTVPWPERFSPPWDLPPNVEWQPGDEGFVVFDIARVWLVGLDGSSRAASYQSYALAIDPDGPIYQNDFENRTLLTWEGNEVVDESPFVQCERMVARHGLVACTTGSLQFGRSGPVVVEADSGDVVAYAPIKDRHAQYSDNGGLTVLGFVDEDTVLMIVGPAAYTAHDVDIERHLVAWQFRTGELERISTGPGPDLRALAVAPELVE
jgi:hypothetical protein